KSRTCRHIILKKGLMRPGCPGMARSLLAALNHAQIRSCVAYSQLILRLPRTPFAMSVMTNLFSTAQHRLGGSRLLSSSHLAPVIVGCGLGMGAIVLVTFLL